DALPWTKPAAETENLSAQVDTDPHTPKKVARRPRRHKAVKRKPRHLWWVLGSLGSVAFLGLVGVLVWKLAPKAHKETTQPVAQARLFVSNRPGDENTVRTIGDAVRKAKRKDHIVVLGDVEEQLELTASTKELTIEPA